jgi:hypothetical protein
MKIIHHTKTPRKLLEQASWSATRTFETWGEMVLDSPAFEGWAETAQKGAPPPAKRSLLPQPNQHQRIPSALMNCFHRRVAHRPRTIGRG